MHLLTKGMPDINGRVLSFPRERGLVQSCLTIGPLQSYESEEFTDMFFNVSDMQNQVEQRLLQTL